jgi:hypothetical protein
VGWTHVTQDRDQLPGIFGYPKNFRVHKTCRISPIAQQILTSQEGLYALEPVKFPSQTQAVN